MGYNGILQCVLLFSLVLQRSVAEKQNGLIFPEDFMFGVATASYQVEGAWNVSDKSESMWDRYTHTYRDRVFDGSNGDEAADSYHRFREDVALMKQLGVDFYRFSISWPRLLPDGYTNKISKDGLRYYNELIDELIKHSIKPVVTMYHWDLPQSLQDLGGWTSPVMAEYFQDYAEVLYREFGDRVKVWITFNEPFSFCHDGYGGDDAPGGRSSGIEAYLCGHNVLRAHGMAYRLYHEKYNEQQGSVGITLCIPWMEPATNSSDDYGAAERARQFVFGWFAHPIFSKHGDYPPVMRLVIDENSKAQNYPRSRLPYFTSKEIEMIKGSFEFLGLNHYTTNLIKDGVSEVEREPSFSNDMNVIMSQDPDWPSSNSSWLKVVPWGFKKSLNWVRITYDNPMIIVTENGISSEKGLNDGNRIAYIKNYLQAMSDAILDHGCTVIGYTYWSLIDNFEWMRGYSERFGLFEVDYSSPNRTRTARSSAAYFADTIRKHKLRWSRLYNAEDAKSAYYSYEHIGG